jgi:mRNA deadenylase 3'-5' endonuclease subunit Ccr4
MQSERVLSLDMSTKTGWALIDSNQDGIKLLEYGVLEQIHTPEGPYPESFVDWTQMCHDEVMKLIIKFKPDVLVIEETAAGSKSIYSQKILEFLHYKLAFYIKESKIKAVYILTEQWRRETGCIMSKEEKMHNKEVKKYKDRNDSKIAYDINGKRTGKITRKHVNIRRANEVFGEFFKEPLKRKDEDKADACLLAFAYHLRRLKSESLSIDME